MARRKNKKFTVTLRVTALPGTTKGDIKQEIMKAINLLYSNLCHDGIATYVLKVVEEEPPETKGWPKIG